MLLGVERGPPRVQSFHLRLWQAGHWLEHQHPCAVTGEVRWLEPLTGGLPWTCDWGRLCADRPAVLCELDLRRGFVGVRFTLYPACMKCIELCSCVLFCPVFVLASSVQWERHLSLQRVAVICWHWPGNRRQASHCETSVSLCAHAEREESGISGTILCISLVWEDGRAAFALTNKWQEW